MFLAGNGRWARPRALHHRRDRLRPGQQLPRCFGGPGATIRSAASGSTSSRSSCIRRAPPTWQPGRAIRPLPNSPRSCTRNGRRSRTTCILSFEGGRVTCSSPSALRPHGCPSGWRVDAFFLDGFAPTATRRCGRRACSSRSRGSRRRARRRPPGRRRAVRDALRSAPASRSTRPPAAVASATSACRASCRRTFDTFSASTAPGRPHVRPVDAARLIVGGGRRAAAPRGRSPSKTGTARVRPPRRTGQRGSGNPGGLFHGIVTPDDGDARALVSCRRIRLRAAGACRAGRWRARRDRRPAAARIRTATSRRCTSERRAWACRTNMCRRFARGCVGARRHRCATRRGSFSERRMDLAAQARGLVAAPAAPCRRSGAAVPRCKACSATARTGACSMARRRDRTRAHRGAGNAGDALRLLGANDARNGRGAARARQVSTAPAAGLNCLALPLAGAGYAATGGRPCGIRSDGAAR